jgi:hypothetical protein
VKSFCVGRIVLNCCCGGSAAGGDGFFTGLAGGGDVFFIGLAGGGDVFFIGYAIGDAWAGLTFGGGNGALFEVLALLAKLLLGFDAAEGGGGAWLFVDETVGNCLGEFAAGSDGGFSKVDSNNCKLFSKTYELLTEDASLHLVFEERHLK